MVLQKLEALETQEDSLLAKLEELEIDHREVNEKEESNFTTQIADMIMKYESQLKAATLSMNYAHRGLKVKWLRMAEKNDCNTLAILQNDQEIRNPDENEAIVTSLKELLRMIDWISQFRIKFRETMKKRHLNKIIARDYRRDEMIEENLEQYKGVKVEEQKTEFGHSTTKDKLLNKTKHLSSKLLKGSQILQSGILQSDLNLDELRQQTHNLTTVNDKYTQFESVFLKTNQLVKTLEKASHREKRDVYIALGFLCLSAAWVLWRRIFKLPIKLVLFVLFRFFKGILATMGFVSKISSANKKILAVPVRIPETAQLPVTKPSIDSIEHAVEEAMNRILSHDEL